jgi:phosphate:Na+ symporter
LLPVIFAGVMMRFFAGARLTQAGMALAGFGLVFLGIDLLQQAAAGYSDFVDLSPLAADTWLARFKLLALGILITLLTQSSSAGVAATLVAINAGAINFQQAAALVIGMDVGTTVTAAMATVGASLGARRTGFSHVIYNLLTAIGALLIISPFTWAWPLLVQTPILDNPEIALVAFHTTFNLLGVLLVLPFTPRFARMMEALIPETRKGAHRVLDEALLKEPGAALLAARQIIVSEFLTLMININLILEQEEHEIRADMQKLQRLLDDTHEFLDRIVIQNPNTPEGHQLVALIHAIDHMQRLHERCDEDLERAIVASHRQELVDAKGVLDEQIDRIIEAVAERRFEDGRDISEQTRRRAKELEEQGRGSIYRAVARDIVDIRYATECAEALRWLTRVSHHISRICHYLSLGPVGPGKAPASP